MNGEPDLVVRAVKARQGDGTDVFSFFLYGPDPTRIADISRIARDDSEVKGFQRKEIRMLVNAIVEFLDSGPVLFQDQERGVGHLPPPRPVVAEERPRAPDPRDFEVARHMRPPPRLGE